MSNAAYSDRSARVSIQLYEDGWRELGSLIKNPDEVTWERPKDIERKAKFKDGDGSLSRFEPQQGSELGDCWFIAATAVLATKPVLIQKVVPENTEFSHPNYAGEFRFNIWRFGQWKPVKIDDFLPTRRGQPIFCLFTNGIFWPALLEKAYATLMGSYTNMNGGSVQDALEDFTGGIGQVVYDLHAESKNEHFFARLLQWDKMNTLMGCSTGSDLESLQIKKLNERDGLVVGHAYSITKVAQVKNESGQQVRLIRLRNPWGYKEWIGSWSDKSDLWKTLSEQSCLDHTIKEDGEFYMAYEDFVQRFQQLKICHLPPNTHVHPDWIQWEEIQVKPVNKMCIGSETVSHQFTPSHVNEQCVIVISMIQERKPYEELTIAINETAIGRQFKKKFNGGRGATQYAHVAPGLCVVEAKTQSADKRFLLRVYTAIVPPGVEEEYDTE